MKKTFIFSILLVAYLGLHAQSEPKGFHLDKQINMAAILAPKPSTAIGFRSVSEARSIINDIMDAVNMQQNFKVLSTTQIDNAAAVMYQGQRYILYNPSFISQLDNAANNKWASISVLGHEIGHHLLGHTLDGTGSQIPKELAADEFSGFVLHRMGATLQQAQLAMQLIGSPNASATHPAERDRLAAIAKGYNGKSMASDNGNRDVAIDYPNDRRSSNNYPTDNVRNNYPNNNSSQQGYPNSRPTVNNYPVNDRRVYPGNKPSDERNSTGTYERRYPNTQDNASSPNNSRDYGRRSSGSYATINYDVVFKGVRSEEYFITSQNNVVKLNGNRLLTVAKLAASNNSRYPYVIFDDETQLYIDTRGNIINEYGRNVGYINKHS
jgi:hypothetical protein